MRTLEKVKKPLRDSYLVASVEASLPPTLAYPESLRLEALLRDVVVDVVVLRRPAALPRFVGVFGLRFFPCMKLVAYS